MCTYINNNSTFELRQHNKSKIVWSINSIIKINLSNQPTTLIPEYNISTSTIPTTTPIIAITINTTSTTVTTNIVINKITATTTNIPHLKAATLMHIHLETRSILTLKFSKI